MTIEKCKNLQLQLARFTFNEGKGQILKIISINPKTRRQLKPKKCQIKQTSNDIFIEFLAYILKTQ